METEHQTRLRRAKESLAACREREAEARKALNDATEDTKRAKDKHDELFIAEENREANRRRTEYNHCTK